MMEMPPIPEAKYKIWDDYYEGYLLRPEPEDRHYEISLYTADQMRSWGESCARMAREEEREKLRALVLDDAWSLTFQTFGQYRTALAAAIRKG